MVWGLIVQTTWSGDAPLEIDRQNTLLGNVILVPLYHIFLQDEKVSDHGTDFILFARIFMSEYVPPASDLPTPYMQQLTKPS